MEPLHRKLVWAERPGFQGWTCTECAWAFNPAGPLVGETIEDMKRHYEKERDEKFRTHICAEHTRPKKSPQ